MRKICVIPGVGFISPKDQVYSFASKLTAATAANVSVYDWQHVGEFPDDSRSTQLGFGKIRDWTWEVIMDYTYVVKELDFRTQLVPDADMYIGHSAGSILSYAKGVNKPMVLAASPLQLIRNVKLGVAETRKVLNVMHKRDPIGTPLVDAVNKVIPDIDIWTGLNPVGSHTSYWRDPNFFAICVDWYRQHVENK
jgi:hypothetical protein